ncbi:uncharacterized protein LOC125662868 [Ostrea edulis]|uniref:uncharacterized protein LOC125662868 n=1 Tax=Ostrea edulis TaxID=37623 RepID=UPI0024AEF9A1|nr:uncharacterized protein LOC125662868 [Ostrea edulis]
MSLTYSDVYKIFKKHEGTSNYIRTIQRNICNTLNVETKHMCRISLLRKIQKIVRESDKLKKYANKERLREYERKVFELPKSKSTKKDAGSPMDFTPSTTTSVTSPTKLTSSATVSSALESCSPINNCTSLKLETSQNITIKHLQRENKMLRDRIKNIKIRNTNRKMKRYSEKIKKLQDKVDFLVKQKETKDKSVQCNTLQSYIQDLKADIDDLLSEKENCISDENVITVNKNVDFKDCTKGKPYNFKLRNLYYIFRSRNIGLQHISPIIEAVLEIFNIHVQNLPCKSTAAVLTSEMGVVARNHVNEELCKSENTTMHRDATTKKGRHFYGVQFNTGEKLFTAGVREVCDGKGETYVSAVKEILSDIGNGDNILNTVSCFMTDRSVTEQKVNNILSKEVSHDVHSFKCAMHPLLQFSDVCVQEIFNIEKELDVKFDGYTSSCKEPFTMFVLRCVSKLFFKDGTGDPNISSVFMKSHGVDRIPLMNFRGNRFNLSFYNAAGTFFMHKLVLQYLMALKSSYTFIQNFIVLSLQNKVILTILKALGILCKIITEPYLVKVSESGDILKMDTVFQRLLFLLNSFYENPSLAMNHELRFFYGPLFNDETAEFLFEMSFNDDLTCVFLKKFSCVLKDKVQKLFSEFLTGGKYFNVNCEVLKECLSCTSNNISVERIMGQLDFKLHVAPNSNVNNMESQIIFNGNKTNEWLAEKNESEKKCIIDSSRKENRKSMELEKKRKEQLFKKHLYLLKQREEKTRRKKDKRTKELDKAIENLQTYGLWENEDTINKELEKLKTKKEKLCALKTQINIYKKIFNISKDHKHLLNFSSKGKTFDFIKLKDNLLMLLNIRKSEVDVCDGNQVTSKELINKEIILTWMDDNGENIEWEGKILSFHNGVFKVLYWDDKERKESSVFELTERELNTDRKDGTLFIIGESTKLDHSYTAA